MAQLRKITPSPVLSNFRQAAPTVGYGFRVLADAMQVAQETLHGAALQEQTNQGTSYGHVMSGGAMPAPSGGGGTDVATGSPGQDTFQGGIQEFVAAMMPHALRVSQQTGLDPRLVIAQAAQETGWGKHAPNNNYFGIKSHGQGGGATMGTTEYVNGAPVSVADSFRTYGGMGQSADDYAAFLKSNPRYGAMLAAQGLDAQLAALGKSGYATDPNYAASVGAIARGISLPNAESGPAGAPLSALTGGEGAPSMTGQAGTDTLQEPTTIRTADGKLESRLFSPAFGPYQEAFNAAAQVAYQSDMMVKGAADLMALSAQYPLDPDSFAQAAQGYVSQVVSSAPEVFRPDLEAEMQQEVQRRYLGILADRQDDIRQRADNSSSALVELWSGNLSAAIASGNQSEIAAAQEKLDSILVARESLPGVGWTAAQSELVRQRAVSAGEADREQRRAEAEKKAAAAQADVQRRADASATALTEMWSDRVSTALASGDVTAAMKAQAELDRVLAQREASPGAIWTPAQSANERAKAIAKGTAQAATAAREAATKASQGLDRAISIAKAGGMDAEEAVLLADPAVAAQFPEKAATLAALADLRTTLPGFKAAPKAEREAQIAAIGTPDNAGEVEKKKALEEVNREINLAFQKDPISAATTYLPEPPPPLPTKDMAPEDAIPMLQARRAYADRLVAEGYAKKAGYLSADEAELVGSLFSKEAPIEARLTAAEMLTKGFGSAAPQVFSTLKNIDPTTKAAGMFSASTGNREVAMEAMMGRAAVDAGGAKASFTYGSIRAVDPTISAALAGMNVPESDVLALAAGIMAYQNPEGFGKDDRAARDKAASSALNRALGMSVSQTGEVTGGVQNVMGFRVLLPVGVSGAAVEEAFGYGGSGISGFLTQGFVDMAGGSPPAADFAAAGIGASAGSVPMSGGRPLTADALASGNIMLVPVRERGPTAYRMIWSQGAGAVEVRDSTGGHFIFDLEKLVAQ